jgi:hypothetical protein
MVPTEGPVQLLPELKVVWGSCLLPVEAELLPEGAGLLLTWEPVVPTQ